MLYTTEHLEQIERTRFKLDTYHNLPLLKKVGRRALNYPSRSERELVRRFDLGQYGRIYEDAIRAINSTAEADSIIGARAYRKERSAGITLLYSRTIEPKQLELATLNHFEEAAYMNPSASLPPFLGLYKSTPPKIVSDTSDSIGLVAFTHKGADAIRISVPEEAFHSLPEAQRDSLEAFTGRVATYSALSAIMNPMHC